MLGIAWRDGDRLTKPGKGTRGGRKTRDPNSPSQRVGQKKGATREFT